MSARPDPESASPKYWAFISYSSRNRKWAEWLIGALESYRVPRSLIGRQSGCGLIPARLLPVFRDRDELRGSADLEAELRRALSESRFLIVLCSPHSADPRSWVNKEILTFKAMGRSADILALIVAGEPNASDQPGSEADECFPQALRYDVDEEGLLSEQRVEPLAADVRRESDRPRTARRKALVKLIARIIDVDFDSLWQREQKRLRKRRAIAGAAAAALLILIGGLGSIGIDATRAEVSTVLAGRADAVKSEAPDLALFLSAAAYATAPTATAYGTLLDVVESTARLVGHLQLAAPISALGFGHDNRQLAVAVCEQDPCSRTAIQLYDVGTLELVRPPNHVGRGAVSRIMFHPKTGRLYVIDAADERNTFGVVDLSSEEPKLEFLFRGNAEITAAEWSTDGRFYAVATGREFKLFPEGAARRCDGSRGTAIETIAFGPRSAYVALGGEFDDILVVDTERCDIRRLLIMRMADIAFDSTGRYLTSIMPDGTVNEWDLEAPEWDLEAPPWAQPRPQTFNLEPFMLDGFIHVFSEGGHYLASTDGLDVLVRDFAERRRLEEPLSGPPGSQEAVVVRLAIEWLEVERLRGHRGPPTLLRFSNDGLLLATADDEGSVFVWDVIGEPLVEADTTLYDVVPDVAEGPSPAAVSPDGRVQAQVMEEADGCVGDFTLRCERVTRLLLTDTESGESIHSLETVRRGWFETLGPDRLSLRFTADGNVVTTAVSDDLEGPLAQYRWHIEPSGLLDRACARAVSQLDRTGDVLRQDIPWWQRWLVADGCASP